MMIARSGLVIPIRLPPTLARVRARWDRAALAGARSHITVLYPFLPPGELTAAVRVDLAGVARSEPPFEALFRRIRSFDHGLIWLEPEPAEPVDRLTARILARWPAYPPYEGMFATVIPHLTIAESGEAPLAELNAAVHAATPFRARATHLELWRQDEAGRWRTHWRLPLGPGRLRR
jgi:2'-5' RNA ligase